MSECTFIQTDAQTHASNVYLGLSGTVHILGYIDPRQNPFTPGAGQRPPRLAGRDDEIERFETLLERLADGRQARSVVYSGLRGVGKTVLLMEFDTMARERGWASTGLHEVGSQPDFRITFGRMAAQLLRSMSRKERMKRAAERALTTVEAFSALAPGNVRLKLGVEAGSGIADSGDPEEDLAELLGEIGEVAKAGGTGALFLIDEMQNLDAASLAAICMALHRVGQQELPVGLAAAGLPVLPERLFAAKPYASRLFSYEDLAGLSTAAAHNALVAPSEARGVSFEPEAVEHVLEATEGYPYFVQEYGRVLWNEVDDPPIRLADAVQVDGMVSAALAGEFFEPYFRLASDAQQRYLMAMGDLGDGPYATADVNSHLGHRSRGGSSQERDSLIDKELIWSPRRGVVDFTIARFAAFIGTVHPYDGGAG